MYYIYLATIFTRMMLTSFFADNQCEIRGRDNYAGKFFEQIFCSAKSKFK